MRANIYFLSLCVILITHFQSGFSLESEKESQIRSEIISRLEKWARDFNDKNPKGVCDLFGTNLLARHVGIPDNNYEELCQSLRKAIASTDKTYFYEPPKIERIFVDNDLAAVSVIWTLKISSDQGSEYRTDKSLDIFERQNGNWKMVTFYSFTAKD